MTQPRWSRQPACTCEGQPRMTPQITPKPARGTAEHLWALQNVQRMFDGQWTSAILVALSDGPQHYKQIRDRIRALTAPHNNLGRRRVLHDSVLTRTLKSMTAKELIERKQLRSSFPPSVQYALTPATAEALSAWDSVIAWARKHADLVARVRRLA